MTASVGQHIASAFFAVAIVGPAAWMLMDRDPPHIRESGQILADDPEDCGLPSDAPRGVSPGACVAVDWKIKTIRTCQPSSHNSTTRKITDAQAVPWDLAPVATLLGKADSPKRDLFRNFILPSGIAAGPATYQVTACFTCNPLHALLFWPVCVDKPDINFDIVKP